MNAPPCVGRWELFDSTDLADHREAATLCETCPMIANCRAQLDLARRESSYGGPQGTWAGKLINTAGTVISDRARDTGRIAVEEAAFSDLDCLAAKAAYERGERSDWILAGTRTYERRRRRRHTTQGGAA